MVKSCRVIIKYDRDRGHIILKNDIECNMGVSRFNADARVHNRPLVPCLLGRDRLAEKKQHGNFGAVKS